MQKNIIVYRCDQTGVFRYEYYQMENKEIICSISSLVLPEISDCRICMNGKSYKSRFDKESTLVKGLRRFVLDQETEKAVGYIELSEWNESYLLVVRDEVIEVKKHPDETAFVFRSNLIAAIRRDESHTMEDEYGNIVSSEYLVQMDMDVADDIVLMILSFLALQF